MHTDKLIQAHVDDMLSTMMLRICFLMIKEFNKFPL